MDRSRMIQYQPQDEAGSLCFAQVDPDVVAAKTRPITAPGLRCPLRLGECDQDCRSCGVDRFPAPYAGDANTAKVKYVTVPLLQSFGEAGQ